MRNKGVLLFLWGWLVAWHPQLTPTDALTVSRVGPLGCETKSNKNFVCGLRLLESPAGSMLGGQYLSIKGTGLKSTQPYNPLGKWGLNVLTDIHT